MPTPSRVWFEQLLRAHAYCVNGLVLNVGGGRRPYRDVFESRMVNTDLFPTQEVDVVCDFTRGLPFATHSFSAAVCTSVLEHVSNPLAVVREVHRVLKPNGVFICYAPFLYPVHPDPKDFWRFAPDGLRQLSIGYQVLKQLHVGGKWILLLLMLYESRAMVVRKVVAGLLARMCAVARHLDAGDREAHRYALGWFVVCKKPSQGMRSFSENCVEGTG